MLSIVAEKLVSSVKQATGYEAAIFDKNSITIAATDTERIGQFNEGSVNVIKLGKPLEHREGYIEHMQNTRPGHAFPIFLNGQVIGAVGIEGKKEEVKKYAQLVQQLAEIMLKENMEQVSLLKSVKAHAGLFEAIMSFDDVEQEEHRLISKGYELGIDLRLSHVAIVMDIHCLSGNEQKTKLKENKTVHENVMEAVMKSIKRTFNNPNNVCATVVTDKFTVLYTVEGADKENIKKEIETKCRIINEDVHKYNVGITFCVGSTAEKIKDLNHSLKSAWMMLDLAKKIDSSSYKNIYFIEDYFIETLMFSVERKYMEWYIDQHLKRLFEQTDAAELVRTIKCWCESGFKYKTASDMLFIHRNTLIYRLEKINTLCDIDINKAKDAFALYLSILKREER